MKNIFSYIIIVAFTFSSCIQNEEFVPSPDVLVGSWESESIEIESLSGEGLMSEFTTYLFIGEDKSFYKNYMSGNWELSDNHLILNLNQFFDIQPRTYKVVDFSRNTMTLQIQTTEGEYCCNFEEFESNEMLLVTEKYVRTDP
ncbi:MAG: hypothetical protein WD059_04290 [Balneolaceae bacterium]